MFTRQFARLAALLVAVVAAVSLTACGGGSSTSGGPDIVATARPLTPIGQVQQLAGRLVGNWKALADPSVGRFADEDAYRLAGIKILNYDSSGIQIVLRSDVSKDQREKLLTTLNSSPIVEKVVGGK